MPNNANASTHNRDPTSNAGPYQRMRVVAFFLVFASFVVGFVLWQIVAR